MLALTRRTGQKIRIRDDIVITVAEVRGDTVRLRIEAPRDVRILRDEVYERVAAENAAAATIEVSASALRGLLPGAP